MNNKAIIFDLFGTLVEMVPFKENESIMKMAETLELPYDEFVEAWFSTYKNRECGIYGSLEESLKEVCILLNKSCDLNKIIKAKDILLNYTDLILKPRPHNVETLVEFKKMGFKLGLISGCSHEVPLVWEKNEMAKVIDAPVFSCKVGLLKPDPKIYLLAAELLNVPVRDCIFIGDGSNSELHGALNVGMIPILFRVDYDREYDIYRNEVNDWDGMTISSIKELFLLLGKIDQ